MIKSKKDLKYYLEQDKIALYKTRKRPRIIGDEIWRFQIYLRKAEYALNCQKSVFCKPIALYRIFRYYRWRIKLGFSIPLNVFEEGLSIAHIGTIVVNGNARIGKNCRIQENVTIGATGGSKNAPVIGKNVFIGSGARIIGDITIADDVTIGANSAVVKTVEEHGVTVAGVPAKIVSEKSSEMFISPDLNK